jgi:hypothetical protein
MARRGSGPCNIIATPSWGNLARRWSNSTPHTKANGRASAHSCIVGQKPGQRFSGQSLCTGIAGQSMMTDIDLHAAKNVWLNNFRETGEFDEIAFAAMVESRQQLHQKPPETLFDCLLLCGAIRSVARFGLLVTHDETSLDDELTSITKGTFSELAKATTILTQALEKFSGVALDDMNLFNDGDALQ